MQVNPAAQKGELVTRVRDIVARLREVRGNCPELRDAIALVDADLGALEQEIAHQIDRVMVSRLYKHNTPPPVPDIHGLTGQWGGHSRKKST